MPSPRACSRSFVRTAPTSCCSTTGSGTHRGRWRPSRASSGPRAPAASASLVSVPAARRLPPVPGVAVSDAQVAERTGSRSTLTFTVRLDEPTSRATSVLLSTAGGSARSGVDYIAQRVRVGFPVGVTRAVVRVPVLGDSLDEATESVRLRLSAPRGLTIRRGSARGTIRDDDAPPLVRLGDTSVSEPATGSIVASVPVTLSGPSGRTVSVRVHTTAGTADTSDFTPVDTTVTFAPGTTSQVRRRTRARGRPRRTGGDLRAADRDAHERDPRRRYRTDLDPPRRRLADAPASAAVGLTPADPRRSPYRIATLPP